MHRIEKKLHKNLNRIFKKQQITITEFAQEVGVTRSVMSRYLSGKIKMRANALISICERYHLVLADFTEDFKS